MTDDNPRPRLLFLDNLRTFLIFLVVLVHAGVVYEASGALAPYWIVVDPKTSVVPGLLNLMLDIFVMPTIFFISGYFAPGSVARKDGWAFLRTRFRRLMAPWIVAVLTLMPLYKVLFLYSRGLPQESWTTYFHFSNGVIGMSWLWFLPALFLFDALYLALAKLDLLPTARIPMRWAVAAVFGIGFVYTVAVGAVGWIGWTKTPLIDFQNERLLPYFLVFLLGSLGYEHRVFDSPQRGKKLYVWVLATVWIPMNLYVLVLLNFYLHPGEYFVSADADGLMLWLGFHLSLLGLLYVAVATFQRYFNRQRRLGEGLGKLAYDVYVVHVVVMGPIAMALVPLDVPALVKYPLLALATWAASNLIAYGYDRTVKGIGWRAASESSA